MTYKHAAVWIDHHEAKVLFLHEDDARFEEQIIKAHEPHSHNHHHHEQHRSHGHDRAYYEAIVQALKPAAEVFLTGPANAKHEFFKFLADHAADTHRRVLGVESVDHPTEGQLAAQARDFFRKADALRGDRHHLGR